LPNLKNLDVILHERLAKDLCRKNRRNLNEDDDDDKGSAGNLIHDNTKENEGELSFSLL